MIEFAVQIDTVAYKQKPTPADIQKIKPRLAQSESQKMDIVSFTEAVLNGYSFTPAILKGGAKAANWNAQQLFCLDIDNEDQAAKDGEKRRAATPLTVEEVLRRCEQWGIKPSLIYETFSSTEEWQKFRVVFVSEVLITDSTERDKAQRFLMELFPESDKACKNKDRLFFGGKESLYFDEAAFLVIKDLPELPKQDKHKGQTKPTRTTGNAATMDLEELKRQFDFLGYIRSFGGEEKASSGRIGFNPCPICGHNDDFYYYLSTNTFNCFSTSGNIGGSVIDFIMGKYSLGKTRAIEFFKYDLLGISKAEEKAAFRRWKMIQSGEKAGIELGDNGLPSYIFEKTNEKTGDITYQVSCPLLGEYIRKHCHYIMVRDKNAKQPRLFWYQDGVYRSISDDELQGYIKQHITSFEPTLLKMRDVREVAQDIKTDLRFHEDDELNKNENIINFQNGLLYLDDMKLRPHTPDIFSTIQIPSNYNPDNKSCPAFLSFLAEFTGNDQEKIEFLLQYMGVIISNIFGYRFKKGLFMYGKGDTGKTVLKNLTEMLLGRDNCSTSDLSELEERFGTSKLYLKRLFGSGDMSYVSVQELKIFKNATGGDTLCAEFKGRDGFDFRYKGLFWFCMNKLPNFGGDRGPWVYERIIPFECNNVIPKEKQDKRLVDKLFEEREAIIAYLIEALQSVIKNGYTFTIPTECIENNIKYKDENSPVRKFFKECCVMRGTGGIKNDNCTTGKIYQAFQSWYADNISRGNPPSSPNFKKELAEIMGVSDVSEIEKKTNTGRFYNFTLNLETKRIYHFYDSAGNY